MEQKNVDYLNLLNKSIQKYEKANKKFLDRQGGKLFGAVLAGTLGEDIATFIGQINAMYQRVVKEKKNDATIISDFAKLQMDFAEKIKVYKDQPSVFDQDIPLVNFLKMLREQMRFETDGNGERVKKMLGEGYVEDTVSSSLYPQLSLQDSSIPNLFYNSFYADCGSFTDRIKALNQTQQPSPSPTLTYV